jgi:hypothetical protein
MSYFSSPSLDNLDIMVNLLLGCDPKTEIFLIPIAIGSMNIIANHIMTKSHSGALLGLALMMDL